MADQELSDMTAASTLDGSEVVYGLQGGEDRKITVAQIRAASLPLAGGAMSGDLVLAGAPSSALHATSKTYVDDGLAAKAASSHSHPTSDVSGLDAALAGKAAAVHTHTASSVTDFAESVDDRVAALLVEGTGITLTYDDNAGTITIDAAGGGDISPIEVDGDSVGIGIAPHDAALVAIGVTLDRPYNLRLKGIGGIANPRLQFEDAAGTPGNLGFADGRFSLAQSDGGVTLWYRPNYTDSAFQTHPSAAGNLGLDTHDGADYVRVVEIKNGQLFLLGELVEWGANDSGGPGKRALVTDNI